MYNGRSALKSAKKAYMLSKSAIYCKIYGQALARDNHKLEAASIFNEISDKDKKVHKYLYDHVQRDVHSLEQLQFCDPRNPKLTVDLMKVYIEKGEISEAVQVGNRHIEFRGASVEVRELLSKITNSS